MIRGSAPTDRGNRKRAVLIAALQLVLFIASHSIIEAQAAAYLTGLVLDENGSPIEGATVSVWLGNEQVASGSTGADGRFEILVEAEARYAIYVFADDDSTPGVDYLPARLEAVPSDRDELNFTLVSAASLVFDGDIQFVESEELPFSVVYAILDPASEGVMNISGLPLIYGSEDDIRSILLDVAPSHLIVPAGVPFTVGVNCSVLVGSSLFFRSFEVDEPGHFLLESGEWSAVDVRRYSVPFNLGVVEALHSSVESRIGEMEAVGFYLTAAREADASAVRRLSEARYLYEEGRYIESFDAAKRSYLALRQTLTGLVRSYSDAALSVYMLIFFLAFASTAIAFLLLNRESYKLVGNPAVYIVTLVVLYLTYPGSVMIPLHLFLRSAGLAFLSSLTVAVILPRFMRGRGGDGHLPVRNIVVPIFSMAKRSMRRRRLRFALTLTSMTMLVVCFVTLTSFSEGYGLVVSRVTGRRSPVTGVLLRASGYTEAEHIFIPLADIASGWLERQPESTVVSPKAENTPLQLPVSTLNGEPIFGIVGIDPVVESAMIDLEAVLKEGELPGEGGALISEALSNELGVGVGDSLSLGVKRVTLQGVLDDAGLRRLRDLDGSTYLPKKLVDKNPEGPPMFVVEPCEPSEVVVLHISTALEIPLVGINRVDIAIGEGVDVNAFAERLALERGYKAWSSSSDGVYVANLGGYLEGKGLPLIVPWGIVVLNVVVTMLNSMYERRKEIHILSSVGLNPAQIAAIFVAEASIIGVIAGGVGYLGGLSLYRAMAFLQLALEVHQKVSALWSLAAIGIAMTAVLIGAMAALRSSIVITPSLMRRWRIEKRRVDFTEPWEFPIPVKPLPEEVEGFVDFVVRSLRALEDSPVRMTSSIRVSSEAEGAVKRVDFVYKTTQLAGGNFYTKNTLLVESGPEEGEIDVRLRSSGDQAWAHTTGTLLRMIAMRWSNIRGRSFASDLS